MTNKNIFVVWGELFYAENEDDPNSVLIRIDWPVMAYLTEKDAFAHVERANAWLRTNNNQSNPNPHDPEMHSDTFLDDVEYFVELVARGW